MRQEDAKGNNGYEAQSSQDDAGEQYVVASLRQLASPFLDAQSHLLAELGRLDLVLNRQVARLRAVDPQAASDPYRGLYVPDQQVDGLLRSRADVAEDTEAHTLTVAIELLRTENQTRAAATTRALPLLRLARLFGLSAFETDLLLLAIAPELDARYETLYAYLQNDATRKRPTVGLALALFCNSIEGHLAQRACFDPAAPLIANRLLRLCDDPQDREPVLPVRFLKVEPGIVDYVLGVDTLDARLRSFVTRSQPSDHDFALPASLCSQLLTALENPSRLRTVFFFYGPAGSGRRSTAETLCARLGLPLLVADLGRAACEMPLRETVALRETLALLRRQATLDQAALFLDGCEVLLSDETGGTRTELARSFADRTDDTSGREIAGIVFLSSQTAWGSARLWGDTRFFSFAFPLPATTERLVLWQKALTRCETAMTPNLDLAGLADRFALSGGQIVEAVRQADRQASLRSAAEHLIGSADLYSAARHESSSKLGRLAQKIEPFYAWDDIVLPRKQMQALCEICDALHYRHIVHATWGFERKLALGKGLTALFAGPSGTGKTMAAQIVARQLELDLYRIDLSSVVSKYIGETEKNLSQIFSVAEASNAILFFDEADALFGKRSEVKDAHDRYANIEVAYLLQKMEEHHGVAILATNMSRNMDDAFARRLSHTVEFLFPDAAHRLRIWRQVFPTSAPLSTDVDFPFLAEQFHLAGGNIRNVALSAAFMAAANGSVIGMRQLITATAREIEKLGKLPSRSDFGQYYDWLRDGG